jgi:hypothetical protein
MRPPRSSSFICPVSEAPHQKWVTPAVGAASRHALALREAHAPGGSKSAQQVLTADLPTWAAATAAAGRRAGRRKDGIDTPDSEGRIVCANDTPLVDCGRPLGKCRTTTMSACRLAPLLRARHRPARDKTNLRASNELVDLGFKLLRDAQEVDGLDAAITHRDGLLIGFLALIPLRRRNLADLVLERTLVRDGATWTVAFSEDDTKTHAAFEIGAPDVLRAPLEAYLEKHRPYLMGRSGRWSRPIGGELWVSKDGSPMTQMAIYDRRTAPCP